jgi:hypothetical protein
MRDPARINRAAIALETYELHHGKPAPSSALVPEILPECRRLHGWSTAALSTHLDGDFVLYSVGTDGRDDGGDQIAPRLERRDSQIVERTDIVWPKPATPEEIAAAEAKVSRKKEK